MVRVRVFSAGELIREKEMPWIDFVFKLLEQHLPDTSLAVDKLTVIFKTGVVNYDLKQYKINAAIIEETE